MAEGQLPVPGSHRSQKAEKKVCLGGLQEWFCMCVQGLSQTDGAVPPAAGWEPVGLQARGNFYVLNEHWIKEWLLLLGWAALLPHQSELLFLQLRWQPEHCFMVGHQPQPSFLRSLAAAATPISEVLCLVNFRCKHAVFWPSMHCWALWVLLGLNAIFSELFCCFMPSDHT